MPILTPQEKEFLDVFLHEATTEPFFRGPASKLLFGIGVQYHDISFISWAYGEDVPVTFPPPAGATPPMSLRRSPGRTGKPP